MLTGGFMTPAELYVFIMKNAATLDWDKSENDRGECIISVKDKYSVNLAKAASFNFPDMGKGIVRCILAHNGLDWLDATMDV